MKLNTKSERRTIKEFIKSQVDAYNSPEPVQFIQLGYQFDQDCVFCVYLDASDNAGPDGSWTMQMDNNVLRRKRWKKSIFVSEEKHALALGEMIKEAVLEARNEGIFEKLNKADGCDIGIEEFNGHYGWPEYEKRKTINLA